MKNTAEISSGYLDKTKRYQRSSKFVINLLQLEIEFLSRARVRMQPIYVSVVFQIPAILSRISKSAVYLYFQ